MAGLDSILSTAQNIATAINGLAQNYLNVQGAQSRAAIAAATLVKNTSGRMCMLSITTAGAAGAIYDANDVALTTNKIFTIPASLGIIFVNMPVNFGIVVVPGAGQVVSVSYS